MARLDSDPDHGDMPDEVDRKAERIRRGQRQRQGPLWFGLGTFGLVGWSVAVPTLAGVGIGIWLDHRQQTAYRWTLALLLAGVAVGCWQAYYWIHREHSAIERQEKGDDRE